MEIQFVVLLKPLIKRFPSKLTWVLVRCGRLIQAAMSLYLDTFLATVPLAQTIMYGPIRTEKREMDVLGVAQAPFKCNLFPLNRLQHIPTSQVVNIALTCTSRLRRVLYLLM